MNECDFPTHFSLFLEVSTPRIRFSDWSKKIINWSVHVKTGKPGRGLVFAIGASVKTFEGTNERPSSLVRRQVT